MNCIKCGRPLRCTDRFCNDCGTEQPVQQNLIAAALENDQDAYTALYRQAEKPVRMTVYSIISPDGRENPDADDIIVESMVKGFRSLGQLTNPDSFVAWMRTIARNKSIDYLRRNRDLTFSELSSEETGDFEDTLVSSDVSASPDLAMDAQAKAQLLREILSDLPDEQRTILVMYYYHQMKIREIADELGCSEATVKSRLKYGKSKVEAGVQELEKKQGIRLYSLTPALFLLLFHAGEDSIIPSVRISAAVVEGLTGASAAAGSAAEGGLKAAETVTRRTAGAAAKQTAGNTARFSAESVVKSAASGAAKVGVSAAKTRLIAGICAAVVLAGAGGAAAVHHANSEKSAGEETAVEEQAGNPEEEPVEEPPVEEEPVPEEEPEEETYDYSTLSGFYDDVVSQRASAQLTANADSVTIMVSWASSASDMTTWTMTGRFEEEGILSYDDCACVNAYADADGNPAEDTLYEDVSGYFSVEDGILYWDGAAEENCTACTFVRWDDGEDTGSGDTITEEELAGSWSIDMDYTHNVTLKTGGQTIGKYSTSYTESTMIFDGNGGVHYIFYGTGNSGDEQNAEFDGTYTIEDGNVIHMPEAGLDLYAEWDGGQWILTGGEEGNGEGYTKDE